MTRFNFFFFYELWYFHYYLIYYMNIFFLILIVSIIFYFLLNWFVNSSSKKISRFLKNFLIIVLILISLIAVFVGKYIFSIPFVIAILTLIKSKAGITLFQIFRLWGLLRILKNSGRFNFNNSNLNLNTKSISRDEAYKIFNLNPNKKYNKQEVLASYKKIMKKIHPDISPELSRLATIVNEAKDIVLKDCN
ncbi:MAG: molecular chaperone DnaJ [Pelagibacteraceae bacterium]|nr:MAG: molecular chaperone DnaJ [Pelagibacteraceae bacterium]